MLAVQEGKRSVACGDGGFLDICLARIVRECMSSGIDMSLGFGDSRLHGFDNLRRRVHQIGFAEVKLDRAFGRCAEEGGQIGTVLGNGRFEGQRGRRFQRDTALRQNPSTDAPLP